MRLNRFLALKGLGSRRKVEDLIRQGLVTVNNSIASLSTVVEEGDEVRYAGELFSLKAEKHRTYIYYKPAGIHCTFAEEEQPNLKDAVPLEGRYVYAGRLDRYSEGLLVLTTDGDLAHRLTHPSFGHEKEYLIDLDRNLNREDLKKLASGIKLVDGMTRPCRVEKVADNRARMVLREGKKRQIRRMFEALDYRVIRLVRTRVSGLRISMAPGELRKLNAEQMSLLLQTGEEK